MKIGYVRVSTEDQDGTLQREALQRYGCDKIYEEKYSGFSTDRPVLEEALNACKSGDSFVVWKVDRMGRKTVHLLETVEMLAERGVGFVSTTQGFDTSTASGKLFFTMLSGFAEFERSLIRERVNAGIAAAKAQGIHCGRPRLHEEKYAEIRRQRVGGVAPEVIASSTGVSRSTVYRVLNVT